MQIIPSKDKPIVISAESYKNKSIFKNSILNPKILGSLTAVFLLVVGVGAGVYLTQRPQQTQTQANLTPTDLSFKPPATDTKVGDKFSIDIFANANNNQITSAKLAIKYDPEILELTSITPKEFLPKVLIAPVMAPGSASVSLGTDGNAGISGSGVVATLSFTSKKAAPSTIISLDNSQTQINILGSTTNSLAPVQNAIVSVKSAAPNPPQSLQASASASIKPLATSRPLASRNPVASSSAASFDFNSDSLINSIDLSVVYSAWGNELDTDLKKKADLNGDGTVNGLDYALFLPNLKP